MELKKGMYVRNKYGIGKVLKINKYNIYKEIIFDKFTMDIEYPNGEIAGQLSNKLIINTNYEPVGIKVSPNIIDLIEIGDYVNGRLVHDNLIYLTEFGWVDFDTLEQTDTRQIKSVVTHEQFEKMMYKIGD